MELNHKIKELRELMKVTQHEMADYIGINQNTYHLIETGSSSLKMEHFIKICEKLKKNPVELLSNTINNFDKHDNKIESGGQQVVQVTNLYQDQKEVIKLLANQLAIKDKQLDKRDEQIDKLINHLE